MVDDVAISPGVVRLDISGCWLVITSPTAVGMSMSSYSTVRDWTGASTYNTALSSKLALSSSAHLRVGFAAVSGGSFYHLLCHHLLSELSLDLYVSFLKASILLHILLQETLALVGVFS